MTVEHIHRARPCRPDRLAGGPRSRAAGRDVWSCSIPSDELAFARSVVRVAPTIGRALGSESTRTVSSAGTRAAGCSWSRGRTLDGDGSATSGVWRSRGRCVAVTDVRACYASIAPERGRRAGSGRSARPPARRRRDRSWLRAFGTRASRAAGRAGRLGGPRRRRAGGRATTRSASTGASTSAGWTTSRSSRPTPGEGGGARRPPRRVGIARPGAARRGRPSCWTTARRLTASLGRRRTSPPATSALR